MASSLVLAHPNIVCDESCALNLLRSGRPEMILRCLEGRCFVPLDVQNGVQEATLQSLIEAEHLRLTDLESEEEYGRCVSLAYAGLHNSEAACVAIALNRQWAIATDEKIIRRIFQRMGVVIQIVTTPEIIKHWADVASPSAQEVKATVFAIQRDSGYQPPSAHPLYGWWKSQQSLDEQT